MKYQAVFCLSLLLLAAGTGFAQQDYADFETENMELYRVAYPFEYPDFPEREENAQPVVTNWNLNQDMDAPEKGEVRYKMDPGVNRLISMHKKEYGEKEFTDGYRVQLFAGSSLGAANKIKSDFKMTYDEVECYQDWEQPTFRVRAGDFLTRSEAIIFCNELKAQFPAAFVVKDQVKKPELRKPVFNPDAEQPDSLPLIRRLPDDNR